MGNQQQRQGREGDRPEAQTHQRQPPPSEQPRHRCRPRRLSRTTIARAVRCVSHQSRTITAVTWDSEKKELVASCCGSWLRPWRVTLPTTTGAHAAHPRNARGRACHPRR
jgi:hypothetical protein